MMLLVMKHRSNGQTLLELVISIGVVVFVMLGLVTAVILSLHTGQSSRNRSSGVKYAQEGVELVRQYRDGHTWDTFMNYVGIGGATWCLNKSGVWSAVGGNACDVIDGIYTRLVTLTWNDPLVHVAIDVSWQDGAQIVHSQLDTYLTKWK